MVREIKQQIRTLVRKNLEIPELVPITGCNFLSKDCETDVLNGVLKSSSKKTLGERISVRSIELDPNDMPPEPEYCSIGPEYHNVARSLDVSQMKDIETELMGDMERRKTVMYTYSVAALISLILMFILFSNNSQITNPDVSIYSSYGLLVASFIFPLIAASYLHITISNRVKTDYLMYWLPILIVSSLLSLWWMSAVDKQGLARTITTVIIVAVIGATIGIVVKYVTMFNECSVYQTLSKTVPRETSIGTFVAVGSILLFSFINGWIVSSM